MIDRKPLWNAGLYYAFYLPLNFSEALFYEHGPYINFLYHINKLIKLEARANLHFRTWTTGEDSRALGGSYSVTEKDHTGQCHCQCRCAAVAHPEEDEDGRF